MIKQLHFSDHDFYTCLDSVLKRGRDHGDQVDDIVRAIIARVRTEGDAAVIELTRKFDGGQLDAESMELTRPQRMRYADQVEPELVNALTAATLRIRNFHKKEQLQSWNYTELDGTLLGQKISPLDRVGVYVPGGKAAYPSSVLMTVIPAKVAGVKEIIMVVPTPGGEINPAVIAAAEIAGVDRIFTIGGAQAIAALAYGTASVPAVDKIVGPGNAYVAAAKKMVFGKVGIDMIAGPSEVVVIADSSANPEWVAMDLFAQAEHDERAQAIAIVTSPMVGEAIIRSAKNLLPHMARRHIIEKSLLDNGAVIYVDNLDQAVEVSDYIAPEHLELVVSAPEILAGKINHAGAIFIGKYSAEALADYCAGPNHVLPTSGTARFSSPLGVYDFQKRSSIMMASLQGAEKMSRIATVLASCEGLTAHEQAARYRGLEAAGHSRQISTKQETKLLINSIVPEQILGMRAYKIPDSRKLIKLDAMENPYSLPEAIHQEWLQALASVPINRYPDSGCRKLKKRLSGYIGMPDRCRLILGNGSDEIIQMLVLMLGGKGRVIMAPTPSFSMYRQICLITSTEFVGVPLQSDFSLDANAMLKAIELYQPSCIFLAYPNNPTGNTFDPETIRSIIKQAPGLVVIDEAYYAFCGKSFLHEVPDYSNVVLLRTLSKSGLAGLRLGYAVASRQWCAQIEKLRPPYNINVLTQTSVEFILAHASILETQAATIIKNRDMLFYDLNSISGLEVFHSETNFHLIRVAVNADQVFLDLKSMGVLVKNLHGSEPMLENCLRVAIGTPEENDRFLLSITKSLAKSS